MLVTVEKPMFFRFRKQLVSFAPGKDRYSSRHIAFRLSSKLIELITDFQRGIFFKNRYFFILGDNHQVPKTFNEVNIIHIISTRKTHVNLTSVEVAHNKKNV